MMNNSYQCLVHFQAAPDKVYEALTTGEGLKGWWTVDCDTNPELNGVHSFRFEGVLFNSMKVVEMERNAFLRWECVEGWKEWLGTEVTFTLTERDGGGTDLLFEHVGLTPALKCYKNCSNGWDTFIKGSLKDYVDLGKGRPHVPKSGLLGKLAGTAFKVFSSRY